MIVNKNDIRSLTQQHKIFEQIHLQFAAPPNWQRPTGFESLCKIILEQQVSLASAEAHFNSLKNYITDFSASNILNLTATEMRACYISKQKASYLQALATAVAEHRIHFELHASMQEQDIRNELVAVKGIGEWTANVYLMMCLQRKDIFPLGDIALQNAVKKLFPISSKEEIKILSETWAPLRSLASYYLWHWYLCNKIKK